MTMYLFSTRNKLIKIFSSLSSIEAYVGQRNSFILLKEEAKLRFYNFLAIISFLFAVEHWLCMMFVYVCVFAHRYNDYNAFVCV